MSRYAAKLPFSPHYDFRAVKTFTLNGREYAPGDAIVKDELGDRRLRQLYDYRMIEPAAAPATVPAVAAPVPAQTPAQAPAEPTDAQTTTPEPQAQPEAAPADGDGDEPDGDASTELPRVEHRGFGRWFLLTADGEQGPMTKAAAEKALAAAKA